MNLDIEMTAAIFWVQEEALPMNRQRKIDEDLWEDGDEKLSTDHVVERFFAQHERAAADAGRKPLPAGPRPKRRTSRPTDLED